MSIKLDSKFSSMKKEATQFAKENPKTTKVAAVAAVATAGVLFAPVLTVLAITGYVGCKLFNKDEPKPPAES